MILVRAGQPRDSERCAEIYVTGRARAFSWIEADSFRLSDYEQDVVGEEVLVAEIAGRVVGFASVWMPDKFLHHLYVDPAHQRNGVGSGLLEQVSILLNGRVRLKCVVANHLALEFYRKRGWIEGEQGDDKLGAYVVLRTPQLAMHEQST